MSKGGASAPPSVNASGLVGAQTGSNIQSAETQAGLNNAQLAGPLGTSYWSPQSTDPNTGLATSYLQSQNLSPQTQPVFNNQTSLASQLAGLAPSVAGPAAQSGTYGQGLISGQYDTWAPQLPQGPVSTAGLAPLPTSASDFQNEVTGAQNAAYNTQAGYLDPQFAEKQSDLNQQLADQGITAGSSAYDRAQGDLGRQSDLAYQQAQNAAVQAGDQEQAQLFGENLGSRQQGFNEAVTQWGEPLSALSQAAQTGEGILSGASQQLPSLGSLGNFTWAGGLPSEGGSPSTVTPPNIGSLQSAANQGNINSFLAGNTLNNQLINGLGSLGGVAGQAGGIGNLLGLGAAGNAGGAGATGLFGVGGLLGSQGPLLGTAADASIAGGGPPLALGLLGL